MAEHTSLEPALRADLFQEGRLSRKVHGVRGEGSPTPVWREEETACAKAPVG